MHFFAPERPEASPAVKAWLLDGSALPVVTIQVKDPETVTLLVMLRNYAAGSSFTYKYHYIELKPTEVSAFFTSYIEDPEGTIEAHTGWKPQKATRLWNPGDAAGRAAGPSSPSPSTAAKRGKPVPSAEDKALFDLL